MNALSKASRRRFLGWSAGIAASSSAAWAATAMWPVVGTNPGRGPDVPDMAPRQFSKHVWGVIARESMPTEEDLGLFTNTYFVVTKKGVVMYDTGASVQIGEMLIRQIRAVTQKPVVAVVNSHWHGDHWLGNQAFTDAYGKDLPIYALAGCREGVAGAIGQEWEKRLLAWTNQAVRGTRAVIPNKDIVHGQVLDFGDVSSRPTTTTPVTPRST